MIVKRQEEQINLNNIAQDIVQNENNKNWKDGSVKGIWKAIEWPHPLQVLKYATYSMISSIAIGSVLYIYGYGINQLIALIK